MFFSDIKDSLTDLNWRNYAYKLYDEGKRYPYPVSRNPRKEDLSYIEHKTLTALMLLDKNYDYCGWNNKEKIFKLLITNNRFEKDAIIRDIEEDVMNDFRFWIEDLFENIELELKNFYNKNDKYVVRGTGNPWEGEDEWVEVDILDEYKNGIEFDRLSA